MENGGTPKTIRARLLRRVLSVPLYVKILGIGLFLTVIFGAVMFFQLRGTQFRIHNQIHLETVYHAAQSLVSRLERLGTLEDTAAVEDEIGEILYTFHNVRYIVVQDVDGHVAAYHFGFPKEFPHDPPSGQDVCMTCHVAPDYEEFLPGDFDVPLAPRLLEGATTFRRFIRTQGTILEASLPIDKGRLGTVRVGLDDSVIDREMTALTKALVQSFVVSLLAGQALALVMTYLVVRPIHNLVQTTNRIRDGDFDARAKVFSGDEVGKLALAFNEMAGELEVHRREAEEKEAMRISLIERIVQVQEEERKSVARELHDQLGQSLSKILLTFQGMRMDRRATDSIRLELEDEIRGLIDKVRQLASDIRPDILDDYGLDSALERYIRDISKRVSFPIDYQCVRPANGARLPSRIEVVLYRVTQEAITNIVRHAEASQASVVLLCRDSQVTLVVEDDGRGFDTSTVLGKGTSLGLIGMRERIALVGGDLNIESEPGKGTVVQIKIGVAGEA